MTTHENNIPAQGTTLLNAPEITAALPVSLCHAMGPGRLTKAGDAAGWAAPALAL